MRGQTSGYGEFSTNNSRSSSVPFSALPELKASSTASNSSIGRFGSNSCCLENLLSVPMASKLTERWWLISADVVFAVLEARVDGLLAGFGSKSMSGIVFISFSETEVEPCLEDILSK